MKKLKLLLVEDDKMLCTIFEMFILEMGHELIGIYHNAETALEKCQEILPDIAILDIHIGGNMNGIEVAELLQKQYKIPILYLSGDTEDETLIDADRIECKVFLSKPIYKSTLNMAMTLTRFKNCMYLQTQSLQLEELIFSLTEPALLLKEQQVINMNDNAKELLGANDLKDCNKSILEYIRPDSQPSFLEIYKKLFQHSLLLQYVKLSFLDCNNNSFKRGCSIGFIQDYDGNYTILIFDKLLL